MSDAGRDPGPGGRALARYLRQRREMGVEELFLDVLDAGSFAESAASGGKETSAPTAGAPAGADDERPAAYEALREEALGCTRCRLSEDRTQVVFSDGNPRGRLMVVGEAPGAREDATGLPFVGPAGKLLDLLLATISLSRDDSVYITNVNKCRPPGNRNPKADEVAACFPYLERQIELVAPEVILAVGSVAGRTLLERDAPLKAMRGTIHRLEGVPLVVTYHPAALLRNWGWTRLAWLDLQTVRGILDGTTEV